VIISDHLKHDTSVVHTFQQKVMPTVKAACPHLKKITYFSDGTAETEEELIKRLNEWKENVESKGMRVNMNKTKVMISGEHPMVWQKAARCPCGVCNKGVGSNSLQCTRCQK